MKTTVKDVKFNLSVDGWDKWFKNFVFGGMFMTTLMEDYIHDYHRELEKRLNFVLHELIPHPIKGEITKGKLKWRGIYLTLPQPEAPKLEREENGEFVLQNPFHFPILCSSRSKSGKRQAYQINLNFNQEQARRYEQYLIDLEFLHRKENSLAFGTSTHHNEKYSSGGIVSQIIKRK